MILVVTIDGIFDSLLQESIVHEYKHLCHDIDTFLCV
jgi:hypothetical protein